MKSGLLTAVLTTSLLVAALPAQPAEQEAQARTTLRDRSGAKVGVATLRQSRAGVLIHLELTDLPPGTHAIHVHAVGQCEGDFESAGAHFAPKRNAHGFLAGSGPHAGDLPNLFVPASGDLVVDLTASSLSLADGSLADADGAALVIHERGDDYRTDPSGSSGGRIACGVIEVVR
jgi:Cu-Zn family superoxide dismutase